MPAPNSSFVAIAAGDRHSLGAKSDGSVVAWGSNAENQLNVPAPNTGFVSELKNDLSVAEAVGKIKANSSRWVHESFPDSHDFAWQTGYAAFTVSLSALDEVIRYVDNQEEHHRKTTFEEELAAFLKRHGIQYDPRYWLG